MEAEFLHPFYFMCYIHIFGLQLQRKSSQVRVPRTTGPLDYKESTKVWVSGLLDIWSSTCTLHFPFHRVWIWSFSPAINIMCVFKVWFMYVLRKKKKEIFEYLDLETFQYEWPPLKEQGNKTTKFRLFKITAYLCQFSY